MILHTDLSSRLPDLQGRHARHDEGAQGPDREHCIRHRRDGQCRPDQLCRRQGRHDRLQQEPRCAKEIGSRNITVNVVAPGLHRHRHDPMPLADAAQKTALLGAGSRSVGSAFAGRYCQQPWPSWPGPTACLHQRRNPPCKRRYVHDLSPVFMAQLDPRHVFRLSHRIRAPSPVPCTSRTGRFCLHYPKDHFYRSKTPMSSIEQRVKAIVDRATGRQGRGSHQQRIVRRRSRR